MERSDRMRMRMLDLCFLVWLHAGIGVEGHHGYYNVTIYYLRVNTNAIDQAV